MKNPGLRGYRREGGWGRAWAHFCIEKAYTSGPAEGGGGGATAPLAPPPRIRPCQTLHL